jgi:hypothetical protein
VEFRAIQEYAGTFRDTQGQSRKYLVMLGIQGITGQENSGEYSGIQWNTVE